MAGRNYSVKVGYLPAPVVPDPVGQSPGVWTPVFYDDFAGPTLDASKWQTHYPSDATITRFHSQTPGQEFTNNVGTELEAYQPSALSFDANGLVITTSHTTSITGLPYTSGMVSSYPAKTFIYGYFECRMKQPIVDGSWPAFWLDSASNTWPPELDVMEHHGNLSYFTDTVWKTGGGTSATISGNQHTVDVTQWHVYGMKWTSSEVSFYLDGVQIDKTTTPADIPSSAMYVIANVAVNQDASAQYPCTTNVDYIRVWQ